MPSDRNVKEVIETLCRLLHYHGYKKISPESFRLAKFNRQEAVSDMYTLACQMMDLPQDYDENYDEFKRKIKFLNYPVSDELVIDNISELSSQQLLLFNGFLIARRDMVNELIERIDEDILHTFQWHIPDTNNIQLNSNNLIDDVIILNKKIDYKFRRLHMSLKSVFKVLKTFSKSSVCSSQIFEDVILKELSVFELLHAIHSAQQKTMVNLLLDQMNILSACVKWLNSEALFWKWMNSVIPQKRNICEPNMKSVCVPRNRTNLELNKHLYSLLSQNVDVFWCENDKLSSKNRFDGILSDSLNSLNLFLNCNFPDVVHFSKPNR